MTTIALAESGVALMKGYKVVAFSRIKDTQPFVNRMIVELEATEASPLARSLPIGGKGRTMRVNELVVV